MATYFYETNSSLIDKVEFKYSGSLKLTTDRTYDKLKRLTSIANISSGGPIVSYGYQYNDANQRIRTALADGSYWIYQYDDLGQVTSGRRFWSDHSPVAGQQFDYAFDDIGNRDKAWNGGDENGQNLREFDYTANSLNQYSQRTVPATFDVLGVATATSTVTVNSQTAGRKGEYFWKELTASNGSVADNESVTVSVSGVTSVTGDHLVPKTPEAYTYDDDGNVLTDGTWSYTWDGENRLIAMEPVGTVPAGAKKKMEFAYDYMGRRIHKKTYNWTGGAWSVDEDRRFIYDGWNVILEVASDNNNRRMYVWGLDLSGTMQGAGGVGGLLKIQDWHGASLESYPGYDGNGNIVSLTKTSDGTETGRYEYGPFGELIRLTGSLAPHNVMRFSTKYQDAESGFLYYGYRYYNPDTGRWFNRDPIGERGGRNVSAFVYNNPLTWFDHLGRQAMLPWGWHGPGKPYDPSSNPFAGPPPPAPTEVADLLDQDIKRFRAKLEGVKCLNDKTLYLFSVYMVTDMASGTADLFRFGDGMAAGGIDGGSQDLARFGGIVLAVACPAIRCCKAPGAVIAEGLPSNRGTFYYGGFDPKTGRVHVGSDGHFGGMAQAGGKPSSTMPGISIRQTPDGVFWSNDSLSLRGALTPEEAAKVQQALRTQFKCPVKQVDDIYNP